ncbi:MAG: PH domain-containing protein [bacterium]
MTPEYTFEGSRAGEHVELIIRAHPIQLFRSSFKAFLFAWISIGLFVFGFNQKYVPMIALSFLVIAAGWLFRAIFCQLRSMTLVTNQRLISREQRGFFQRKISEVELSNIQELVTQLNGLWGSIFGSGTVSLKTAAGDKSMFEIKNVPDPYLAQQKISELSKK